MADKKEMLAVVNEKDEVVGKGPRDMVHEKKLLHRAVIFFAFDMNGLIFVNRRTDTKDMFPGYWSIAAGGHVAAGENYRNAVLREGREELKAQRLPFFIASHRLRVREEKENRKVYGFIFNGVPEFDKSEIAEGRMMTLEEIKTVVKKEKFLPETSDMLKILQREKTQKLIKMAIEEAKHG